MGRRKKKNSQNINTKLLAKSTAQLEESLKGFEDIPDPKEPYVFDAKTWGAGEDSEPHFINGKPVTDDEKEEEKDGDTE